MGTVTVSIWVQHLPLGCWYSLLRLFSTSICGHWAESALMIEHRFHPCFSSTTQSLLPAPRAPDLVLNSSVYSQGPQLSVLCRLGCLFRGLTFWEISVSLDTSISCARFLCSWSFNEILSQPLIRQKSLFPPLTTFVILVHDLLCS